MRLAVHLGRVVANPDIIPTAAISTIELSCLQNGVPGNLPTHPSPRVENLPRIRLSRHYPESVWLAIRLDQSVSAKRKAS